MASMISTTLAIAIDKVEPGKACEDMRADERAETNVSWSDEIGHQRWQAFDRLLQVSFGLIPPAYLFTSLPLDL